MSTRAAGFTLLEILVVIAVLGFLLLGLSETVRFGLTAWREDVRMSESKIDLEAVDRTIRAVVENLDPGDDTGRLPIDGTAEAMTGVSRLRIPGSGVEAVPVEAGLAVSGGRLVLRWRPYHHATPLRGAPSATETELLSGVSHLAIEYWQPTGVWVPRWRAADLPLLIRFHVTLAGIGATRWPDIVVAPRLSRP